MYEKKTFTCYRGRQQASYMCTVYSYCRRWREDELAGSPCRSYREYDSTRILSASFRYDH